jgi:hypothetical protein
LLLAKYQVALVLMLSSYSHTIEIG